MYTNKTLTSSGTYKEAIVRSIILLISLFVSSVVNAGDYQLFITEDNAKTCNGKMLPKHIQSCDSKTSYLACDVSDVINDLEEYFKGDETQIGLLKSAFTNGHIEFCSSNVKSMISNSLRRIVMASANENIQDIKDFISVNNL